ncbi:hypothetical protein GGQ84_001503 [Desulfitispora alkaliphila]|uniref:hypothetical protein n=1 Tax=Desulfitispora alkaliphila TaxID=622674 RepID=UPI003D1C3A2F
MDKPHIMKKADFIGEWPVVKEGANGIVVTKAGTNYDVGIEVDEDTVVKVDSADEREIDQTIEELIPKVEAYKERFKDCFMD